jgi:hypothetical protein
VTARRLLWWALGLAAATIVAIWLVDGFVAAAMRPHAAANHALADPFITALEYLFAIRLSKFATGIAIVIAALVLFAMKGRRPTAWLVLYVGLVHLATRLVAGVSKNVFLRLRPYEALKTARGTTASSSTAAARSPRGTPRISGRSSSPSPSRSRACASQRWSSRSPCRSAGSS